MALSHFLFLLEKHQVIMTSTALLIFPLDQIHRPSSHRQELASLWTLHYLYGRKMETSTLDRSIEPLIQTLQWHLQWEWKNSWAVQLIPPSPLTSYTTSLAKSSWLSSYCSFPDWLCHRKPHNFLIASEYTSPENLKWQLFSHIHIEPISITKIAITKLLNHLPILIPF